MIFRRTRTALALLALAACSRKSPPSPEGAQAQGEKKLSQAAPVPLPAVAAGPTQVVSGEALLEQIRVSGAKGTIVNAWASWCGPCRREFPMLVALRDNLAQQGIAVVFVSVDEPESYGAAVEFAGQHGVDPPVLVAARPLGPFKTALNPKWPGMLPATFLYDNTGKLRYFWGGPVYEEELLPIVEGFLAGKPIDGEADFGLSAGKDFRHN